MKKRLTIRGVVAVLVAIAFFAACDGVTISDLPVPPPTPDAPPPPDPRYFVQKIEGLPEDFMLGVDISSVVSLEDSGVVFRDWEGDAADLFELFAEGGANWVRVRIWNDPWLDPPGETGPLGYRRGFGGGNNDVERAIEIGRRATAAGLRVLVNFHYSDFWADPGKQTSPRAWVGMNMTQRSQALFDFTYDTITQMLEADIDIGMVQIGNETNGGIAGITGWANVATLIGRGSQAVIEAERSFRDLPPGDFERQILIAVHKTNPHNLGQIRGLATELRNANVVYDVFGLSYYWFWHGPVSYLQATMNMLVNEFNVDVAVFEVSWPSTAADTDGHPNNWSGGRALGGPAFGTPDNFPPPPHGINVQGQANAIREVAAVVAMVPNNRGLGVFVWEPAWISVGEGGRAANLPIWQRHGSGWASSYAAGYDTGAAAYYGGSSWDNQAFFDQHGHPLRTLRLFYYFRYGSPPEYEEPDRESLALNHSFEDDDMSMWLINVVTDSYGDANANAEAAAYRRAESNEVTPNTGNWGIHWWRPANNPLHFTIEQEITIPETGTYRLSAFFTGGDAGTDSDIFIFVRNAQGEIYRQTTALPGWQQWSNPAVNDIQLSAGDVITIGASLNFSVNDASNGAWGTLDDFYFYLVE